MIEIPQSKAEVSMFSLVRTKKDCYYPPTQADFTPMRRGSQSEGSCSPQTISILPRFNLDGHYFTPTFINPYQEIRQTDSRVQVIEMEKEKFLRKIQLADPSAPFQVSFLLIKNIQFNPRDDNYCSLCRGNFQSYWAHVNSVAHRKQIKSNKFNLYIHELCNKFSNSNSQKPHTETETLQEPIKKKRIYKKSKPCRKLKQPETFTRDDFIIKLPADLVSKQGQNLNYNISTNGLNSLDLLPSKM